MWLFKRFQILCRDKILNPDMENTFISMAKFRNKVVHIYDEADNKEVFCIISDHIDDFQSFINDIAIFINNEK